MGADAGVFNGFDPVPFIEVTRAWPLVKVEFKGEAHWFMHKSDAIAYIVAKRIECDAIRGVEAALEKLE